MAAAVPSFDLILFGGNGDLAVRKLLPALYQRHAAGELPPRGRIVGVGRTEMSREEYVGLIKERCARHIGAAFSEKTFQAFAERLHYVSAEVRGAEDLAPLAALLAGASAEVRVFYLSTAPDLFTVICKSLAAAGLVDPTSRVVLEKPLGRDLASAQEINRQVGSVFNETQIYRIDHYLGKEPVQNLMALRFGNALFEPLWNRAWVRDVQISIAETVGAEKRGEFYDRAGALRDMVQNHLLQLLCIVAMEPPTSIDADAVRDEKLKVLRALVPMTPERVRGSTVRGQYRAGAIRGQPVVGYQEEEGIAADSRTETYVALKTGINDWRWSGVPFFLRTGKRLQERVAEIVINFREVPYSIFPISAGGTQSNRLVIQLQPEEELKLLVMAKAPGNEMSLKPVHLNLDFSEQFKQTPMDAYERLLMDVLRGKLTLFMRHDELDAAWRWIDPILNTWEASEERPKAYIAGTWGPSAASTLLAREGSSWSEES